MPFPTVTSLLAALAAAFCLAAILRPARVTRWPLYLCTLALFLHAMSRIDIDPQSTNPPFAFWLLFTTASIILAWRARKT